MAPHFRPCPSSSCSRPGVQHPQPPAGLPAPGCQASAAPAGLQALARLPLQWRCAAQSLPQLQHGTGWAGGRGRAAKGGGREGGLRQAGSQKVGLTRSSFSSHIPKRLGAPKIQTPPLSQAQLSEQREGRMVSPHNNCWPVGSVL